MAQIKFKADIDVAEFPLSPSFTPRTVISDAPDGSSPYTRPPISHPQILYAQDVIPTRVGYKSLGYKSLVSAVAGQSNFAQVFTVSDQAQNKALIGITLDSRIFILTSALPTWVDVTPALWGGGNKVTYGIQNGNTYLLLYKFGCYLVNITGVSLIAQVLTGISVANILGMSSAVNYILLWDASGTIYWDGTTPLTFTPSTVTGAGSAIPADLAGLIVIIVSLNNGFAIYTTQNIVLCSYSNNSQFPWIMRNASGSSGVQSPDKVSIGHDLGYHIAATFAGILQVTSQGATTIVPELTDFLVARIYDTYNFATNLVDTTYLDADLIYRVTVVGARFAIFSYGIAGSAGTQDIYTDAFIYDTILKKWGKLHINHTCIFELDLNMEGIIAPYNQASEIGHSYASASPQTYTSTSVTLNSPPAVGRIIGILVADGTVSLAFPSYGGLSENAVLWLGKFQATRDYNLVLEELTVEEIATINSAFSILTIPSLNGRDLGTPLVPAVLEQGLKMRRYGMRSEAQNHIIALLGSFNLTSLEITATLGGRR
jgi:hypothetical protein